MKRKTLVSIHVMATMSALLTIGTFFTCSLIAEWNGDPGYIKSVKQGILYALPILIIAMPTLAITGNKLAGSSKSTFIKAKMQRMKMITVNGLVLISLAVLLYYLSHFSTIDHLFFMVQVSELVLGFVNLTLIGLNVSAGLRLSGRLSS